MHTTLKTTQTPAVSTAVKPAISWPGGKSRLLKHILPLIPAHKTYVEPFGGGMAVLLAKPRAEVEVYNDLKSELVIFFRVVRHHADALLTELEFMLNSRQEFRDFRAQPGLTDIQIAARWFMRNKNCFGGANMESFGVSVTSGSGASGSRASRMEAIRNLNMRLDRVSIEHLDWERCIQLYDRPTTFFFIDPPYTDSKIDMYAEWRQSDVLRLRQRLATVAGKWMVTLNDSAPNRAAFAGCDILAVERQRGINNRTEATRATYREIIITPKP